MAEVKQARPLSGPSADVLERALADLQTALGANVVAKIRALADAGDLMNADLVLAALEPAETDDAD